MNRRRGFFGLLATVAATAALDPERLLWIPGKKLISIPAVTPYDLAAHFRVGDIITFGGDSAKFFITGVARELVEFRRLTDGFFLQGMTLQGSGQCFRPKIMDRWSIPGGVYFPPDLPLDLDLDENG